MRLRPPRPTYLALVSAVWFLAGVAGLIFAFGGNMIMKVFSALIAMLAAGLWLGLPWVRMPLLIYWTVVTLFGFVGLFLAPEKMRMLPPLVVAAYSAVLIYRWEPEAPDDDEITTLKLGDNPQTHVPPPN